MKRALILFMLPVLLLGLSSCSISTTDYYEHAHFYLGSGDFATAALMFDQLGEYADSAEFALYCAGLDALSKGDLSLAQADLNQVHPFKSSERYLRLIDAMVLEDNGDLEGALSIYEALGSFEDSQDRAAQLREAIPERDLAHARALMGASRWEQALTILEGLNGYGESAELIAECNESIAQAAYDQAAQLYASGRYSDALAAFEALGDTLDAQARVLMCRGAMYQQLEKDYSAASMATAEDLIARYTEMEDYLESPARLSELEARYRVNLTIVSAAYARPYVRFGSYGDQPLTWRVILVEDSQATLLCQQIFPSTSTDLGPAFTQAEEAGVLAVDFPRLTLDLDRFAFTKGNGTPDDPFQ